MSLLIYNIHTLVHTEQKSKARYSGKEMSSLSTVDDAFLFIKDGLIDDFGTTSADKLDEIKRQNADVKLVDAERGHVFPSWVDSHTHIVFAGSREKEYEDRIKGLSYEEIALRGGGILNSAKMLRNASEDDLFQAALVRLNEIKSLGTGAVEIKSGYGLTVDSELKMLRVIKRLKQESPLLIKATFLGAHAIPEEFKNRKKDYISLL
ncbi:MAG TPA: imidazolonepropionase, partial [Bacteroidia bacterium]|nr:imidazolonepropionase [Bacteroidia bacterium]